MKSFIGNTSSIGMLNGTRLVAYTSAVCLFVFLTLLAFPVTSTSEEAVASTGTAVAADTTLTLSSTNENSLVNVTSTSPQGTFASSDANGTANFSVTTNNFTGYTLSISSDDDAGRLENYTHDYISSISSNLSEADFSNASNTTYNNKWGFKPNKYVSSNTVVDNTGSSSVFLPSPTTTPTVLNITSAANTVDDNYTIGLGIRADTLLPSGVYSKTLNLIALANVVSYTINFNKNTEDTVTNMPTTASGTTSATGITIPNTTPARTGYTFQGWCDKNDAINDCNGTTFSVGGAYGIDQTTENVITLYAIWQPTYYMQDVATWGSSLPVGQSIQAIDRRDNKVYWVTKEETDPKNPRAEIDTTTGKAYQIWMTQNLDFELEANSRTYTHEDTDLGYVSGDTTAEWTPQATTITDVTNFAEIWTGDQSIRNTNYYYPTDPSDVSTEYTTLEACVADGHSAEECSHYKAGTLYNYYVAAAVSATDTDTSSSRIPNSICPAGWRLPSGTGGGIPSDWAFLLYSNGAIQGLSGSAGLPGYTENGKAIVAAEPLWVTRAGRAYNGEYRYLAGSSYLRYDVVYNSAITMGSDLGLDTYASVDSTLDNAAGVAIRCIARTPTTISDISTMQDLAELDATEKESVLNSMETDKQYTLRDARDNKSYTVAKLSSGLLWMTQNLDIAGGTTLTPALSNVASNYTLPASSTVGFDDNAVAFVYNSNSNNCGDNSPCGSYYSYKAATAGTSHESGGAIYDICPKGWRLPVQSEYNWLLSNYTTTSELSSAPWNGTLNGNYKNSELVYGGSVMYYWSSITDSDEMAIRFIFNSSNESGQITYSNKYHGSAVRCVLSNYTTSNISNMQDFSILTPLARKDILDNMVVEYPYRLKDKRDNKYYSVAKLADGNVWMTTNLDLDGGTALYSDTSNVADGYPASGGTPFYTLPASDINGFTGSSVASVYNSGSHTCGENSPCYSYYSWPAATAGTNPSTGDAAYDICPKGWRLPVKSELDAVISHYGNALRFGGYPGNIQNGGSQSSGAAIYIMSSTAVDAATAYSVVANDSIAVNRTYNKLYGFSIRCVLNTSMQDIINDGLDSIVPNVGDTFVLSDKRDNEKYTVGRLADGNVWMLDNLRLGGSAALNLKTFNTNVDSNFTLPASTNSWVSANSYTEAYINSDNKNVTQSYGDGDGRMGNYYNVCAASAGTVCESVNNNDMAADVCPKGWRLPTGGSGGEYEVLYVANGSDTATFNNNLRSPLSGYYNSGTNTVQDLGAYGGYWTSTRYDDSLMHSLGVRAANTDALNTGARTHGNALRCIKIE